MLVAFPAFKSLSWLSELQRTGHNAGAGAEKSWFPFHKIADEICKSCPDRRATGKTEAGKTEKGEEVKIELFRIDLKY